MISEAQKQDLRDRNPVTTVAGKWVKLRRGGAKGCMVGPCPLHSIDPTAKDSTSFEAWADGWVCATCEDGGDVFKLVMLHDGVGFMEAVKILGGEQEVDPEVAARRERERQERKAQEEAEDRRRRERDMTRCERLFDRARPIAGTLAAHYLESRGMAVDPSWTFDLRYMRGLPYFGYADEAAEEVRDLGDHPAMLAAIRDAAGSLIGVHRTYLEAGTGAKLAPPGDRKRNKAKKITGEQKGGLIRLSPIRPYLAMGEGIETSRSWRVLRSPTSRDWAIAAAVSLGNLSGRALTRRDHPSARMPSGRPMQVPVDPDLDSPGIVLPAGVEVVAILGDGDSDPVMTQARLLMGGRRFQHQGVEVLYDLAPRGADFNDVLMQRRRTS
ncbi:DUF7146 domain-containing protein [Ancylobacter amanitiformis]|uniref:Zinc finger CHC2-type domain-containing protein n=1 Tax=Ancylobacter amanitiformis TaxID=217069 RepID=A0ABU0LQD2_9HYPH|nr:CHC2 zinc finger domain-containing protein [Ancylobacter amanitiformis]MDQ0510921.1 hypothetical protein [Ancylobacter amanitiformis]